MTLDDASGPAGESGEQPSARFRALAEAAGIDLTADLAPYDLESGAHLLWPSFPHEWLAVGDVIELKRDGRPDCRRRVTKVIPGPGAQVMYDTEIVSEEEAL